MDYRLPAVLPPLPLGTITPKSDDFLFSSATESQLLPPKNKNMRDRWPGISQPRRIPIQLRDRSVRSAGPQCCCLAPRLKVPVTNCSLSSARTAKILKLGSEKATSPTQLALFTHCPPLTGFNNFADRLFRSLRAPCRHHRQRFCPRRRWLRDKSCSRLCCE